MTRFQAITAPRARAFALTAMAAAVAGVAHAQSPAPKHPPEDPNAPVVVRAEEITGRPERQVNLERDVEVTRDQTKLKADSACYRAVEDEVTASGHIQVQRWGDRYTGQQLQLNLSSGAGWVLGPEYHLEQNNAQGRASRIDFINDDVAVVANGTYSTCEGTNPDWYLTASTLRLDQGRDVGVATGTVVYFKGVPIIGTPAMSFSLSGARRSGWLPPSIGLGSKGNGEVTLPYYFNIAPNRDLTLAPRLMLSRGLQLIADGRYLGETDAGLYQGETQLELLLHDKQTKTNRWLVNSRHSQALAEAWSFGWNVRGVSDNQYPSDFSKSVNNSAERQLLRELRTDYTRPFWSIAARAQQFQILQDPAAVTNPSLVVPVPYDRLPQLNLHAGRYDVGGFDWALDAEATRFVRGCGMRNLFGGSDDPVTGARIAQLEVAAGCLPHDPTQSTPAGNQYLERGNRFVIAPQLSYPIIHPGWYVTPKVMLNAASYALDTEYNGRRSYSRALPTFSLDSGLVFERQGRLFGHPVTQTLEPRLFYVYTPYKDQQDFPNFDSAEAGFNFAQIFTENRFLGNDRISDANQLTAAVVSRFIEESGAERLRLALGQRFYIRKQRVFLVADESLNQSRSDLLLAASGRVTKEWNFDSAIQYDAAQRQVYSSNYGVQWMPGEKRVLNAEYRFQRDSFRNADLSTQWPLARRWYGVGRVSYSLRDRKLLESLVGLEYKADCWVFRMGAQRFVTTAQTTATPVFFQLELNGLSRLGFGNPLESFYKSIPGYTRVNQGLVR
jgi:LPS-assembly protein